MTPGSLARLVAQNVRRGRRTFVLSVLGISVGVASLAFFLALSAGMRELVLGRVFHVERVEIEPPKATLDVPLGGLFGGGPRLVTDDDVAKLRALDGVRRATPRMRLAFPARAWGGAELFGSNRYAELLGEGLDPAAVADEPAGSIGPLPFADPAPPETAASRARCNADPDCHTAGEYCAWDVHECQRPIPMLVSRFLVELYNTSFASTHNLPRISDFLASRFRGFTITVELGSSFLGGQRPGTVPRQRRLMLVGVSDRAIPIGVSLPLAVVQRWNAEYAGAAAATGYSSVTVEVREQSAVTRVAAEARALGLTVANSGAEQAGLAITLLTLLFALVSLAIVAVAVMNIAHTFFRAVTERRRELGILRAIGASARDVEALLLGEAVAIGAVGGVVGIALARIAALVVDVAARRLVPDFPFKPDSFFAFSPALVFGVLLFAIAACVVGALLPARTAARLEPAAALAAT